MKNNKKLISQKQVCLKIKYKFRTLKMNLKINVKKKSIIYKSKQAKKKNLQKILKKKSNKLMNKNKLFLI